MILLAVEIGTLSVDKLTIDKERLAIGNDKYRRRVIQYLEMVVLISI